MLIELVRRGAAEVPDQPVVVSPRGSLTYADCLSRSQAVARGLRADRVGIALSDPGDVLVALAAASALGSEACVYPRGVETLPPPLTHELVLRDGELPTGDGALRPAETAPVLVLTTGTTGTPKGVRHDWARLIQGVRGADRRPGTRWLLTHDLGQFGGLQVLLHVLSGRATLVAAPSTAPEDVVETLRDTGTHHVSATPTFWRVLAGALDEASARAVSLEQITLGGEPVPQGLLDRLRALFPDARISQIYGGTEFGSVVSVHDGRAGLPGSCLEDGRLRIADGELHVRAGEGWRATGDLVELRGDRIQFLGRASEVINVAGVKVHPLPVEDAAYSVAGVELASAYGRRNPVTGQIVALDVVAAAGFDPEAVEDRIRQACESLPPAGRPRRIRFVRELELRGHKLARERGA